MAMVVEAQTAWKAYGRWRASLYFVKGGRYSAFIYFVGHQFQAEDMKCISYFLDTVSSSFSGRPAQRNNADVCSPPTTEDGI